MKKWLSGLLAALMLLSSLAATACSNAGSDTESDTSVGDSSKDTTSGTTIENAVDTEAPPAVNKQDYKGESFHMIAHTVPQGTWYYADEYINSGDSTHVLNNTIYEMNTMVEDHLGVELSYENIATTPQGDILYVTILPSLMAGDDDYQLCITHPYYSIYSFVTQNHALDFHELDDVDLDRTYWNRDVMDLLSINGHAYVGLGDLCRYSLNILYCNKELLKDVNRQVPYDMVRNGTWTLDELTALTTGLYHDNGNGKKDNQDIYGYAAMWDANATTFMQASGVYLMARNSEDDYELTMYGERLINLYEKLYNWTRDESTYLWYHAERNNPEIIVNFRDSRSYFTMNTLGAHYLDASFEYGILPMPKYDAAQEEYAHVNWGNNIIVPSSVENRELVGQVLEMMAYYSRTHVLEVYYNDVLQLRASNAPDDREMVELIYDTVVFDPGIAYCHGSMGMFDLVHTIAFCIRDEKSSLETYYRQKERTARNTMTALNQISE